MQHQTNTTFAIWAASLFVYLFYLCCGFIQDTIWVW